MIETVIVICFGFRIICFWTIYGKLMDRNRLTYCWNWWHSYCRQMELLVTKTNNAWRIIVDPTDTNDFDYDCARRVYSQYKWDSTIRKRYVNQIWIKSIYTYRGSVHLWISSTNKWTFLSTSAWTNWTLLKLEKNCN